MRVCDAIVASITLIGRCPEPLDGLCVCAVVWIDEIFCVIDGRVRVELAAGFINELRNRG